MGWGTYHGLAGEAERRWKERQIREDIPAGTLTLTPFLPWDRMVDKWVFFFFLFKIFGHTGWHVEILVPRPRIEPAPPALEVQSLNHWTAREVRTTDLTKETERQAFFSTESCSRSSYEHASYQ